MDTIKHFIVTHAGCLDGLTAAYFRYHLGFINQQGENKESHPKHAKVYFLKHQTDQYKAISELGWIEELKDAEEYFILEFTDCAPTKETLIALFDQFPNMRIAVLDHHKTAEYLSKQGGFLERESEVWNKISENASRCTFYIDREESKRSAAMMAYNTILTLEDGSHPKYKAVDGKEQIHFKPSNDWSFVFNNGEELLARIVSDRDVWTHTYPSTNQITAVLFTILDIKNNDLPYEDKFDKLMHILMRHFYNASGFYGLIGVGEIFVAKQDQDIRELAKQAQPMLVVLDRKSHHGLLVNAPGNYASDLGNYLLEMNDDIEFVVTYSLGKEKDKFSVRSKETFDSSELCARFGGGGHRRAAGFSLSAEYDHEQFHSFLVYHLQSPTE